MGYYNVFELKKYFYNFQKFFFKNNQIRLTHDKLSKKYLKTIILYPISIRINLVE